MKIWNQALFMLLTIVWIFQFPVIASDISIDNYRLEWQYGNTQSVLNTNLLPENKVYIHPDSIYFSSNQIYVKIAENSIPIQHLSCDENGVFISVQDIQTGRAIAETWICPKENCGYENYVGIDYCGRCGTYRYDKSK